MKKLLIISLIVSGAALLLCSCNREPVAEPSVPIRLEVRVKGDGEALTKVTGVTTNSEQTEAKVNSLQVFVFNGDALDGYGSSSGSKLATVSCTSGTRDIYAVVNGPNLSSVTTKPALLSTVSSLANEISNFQMVGSTSETLEHDGNVVITVNRLAARVVIYGIQNAIENDALASDFTLQSVYLTNVTGDVNYGLSSGYEPSVWYNRRGYESGNNLGDFTYDAVNASVAKGATNGTAHYFYSMPNGYPGAVGLASGETRFTPRAARLVIRVSLAGTLYDYPILLPALESNHSYEINLVKLTRAGNPDDGDHNPNDPDDIDEEKPVEGFEQGFEITVNPWTVVLVGNEGNIEI